MVNGPNLSEHLIVALTSDGKIYVAYDKSKNEFTSKSLEIIKELSEIKSIENINFTNFAEKSYIDIGGFSILPRSIDLMAISTRGNAIYSIADTLEERELDRIVNFTGNRYLNDSGEIVDLNSGIIILKDAVCLNSNYAITRSGNIYNYDITSKGIKTAVYEEWIERMK